MKQTDGPTRKQNSRLKANLSVIIENAIEPTLQPKHGTYQNGN